MRCAQLHDVTAGVTMGKNCYINVRPIIAIYISTITSVPQDTVGNSKASVLITNLTFVPNSVPSL